MTDQLACRVSWKTPVDDVSHQTMHTSSSRLYEGVLRYLWIKRSETDAYRLGDRVSRARASCLLSPCSSGEVFEDVSEAMRRTASTSRDVHPCSAGPVYW